MTIDTSKMNKCFLYGKLSNVFNEQTSTARVAAARSSLALVPELLCKYNVLSYQTASITYYIMN